MYFIRGKVLKLLKTAISARHSGCSRRVIITIEEPGHTHTFDIGYNDEATEVCRLVDDYNRKMFTYEIHQTLPNGKTDIFEFCGSSRGLKVMVNDLQTDTGATIERIINRGVK